MTRPTLALARLIALVIAVAGCGPDGGSGSLAMQLAHARAQWAAAGVTDYRYDVVGDCECNLGGHLGVTVAGGQVVDVVRLDVAGNPSVGAGIGSTVEDLFDMIEDGLADADSVEVAFDPIDGHPVELQIVWVAAAADGAVSARLTLVR